MINEEIIRNTFDAGGEKAVAELLSKLPKEQIYLGLGIVAVLAVTSYLGKLACETIAKIVIEKINK